MTPAYYMICLPSGDTVVPTQDAVKYATADEAAGVLDALDDRHRFLIVPFTEQGECIDIAKHLDNFNLRHDALSIITNDATVVIPFEVMLLARQLYAFAATELNTAIEKIDTVDGVKRQPHQHLLAYLGEASQSEALKPFDAAGTLMRLTQSAIPWMHRTLKAEYDRIAEAQKLEANKALVAHKARSLPLPVEIPETLRVTRGKALLLVGPSQVVFALLNHLELLVLQHEEVDMPAFAVARLLEGRTAGAHPQRRLIQKTRWDKFATTAASVSRFVQSSVEPLFKSPPDLLIVDNIFNAAQSGTLYVPTSEVLSNICTSLTHIMSWALAAHAGVIAGLPLPKGVTTNTAFGSWSILHRLAEVVSVRCELVDDKAIIIANDYRITVDRVEIEAPSVIIVP